MITFHLAPFSSKREDNYTKKIVHLLENLTGSYHNSVQTLNLQSKQTQPHIYLAR